MTSTTTVTVLFTDVVGSTGMRTSRGDVAAQEIMHAHNELVRKQIEEHSGEEVKTIGDSFMLAFASAHKAVECAVAVQRALDQHSRRHPDQRVQLRVGLNTGEVVREGDDLFGAAVDAAKRIESKADAGQILVSEMVRGVIGSAKDLVFVDRGRFRLKGFPERWHLYEVPWRDETAAAPACLERTPFVGREAERAELRRYLEGSLHGQGGLVMIGGEPGVGKTRLAEELAAEARERGALALLGHCYEMEGAPPYIPFVEILESAVRVIPPERLREALGDAAPEVAKLLPELRRKFPDIAPPLELPPEQERHFLFNSVREFVARAAHVQPLLLVLDDLQWADDASLLLLEHIAQQLHELPLLIAGTYRDVELDVVRPLARSLRELTRQHRVNRLALARLPVAGVEAMLRTLSGNQQPPAPLVDVIYGETEGNPFFVEEMFKYLSEERRLFDPEGRWRANLHVGELDVPEGVRLVVGQRLERVCEECRRVLTSAAIIGRGFSFELLEALGEAETDALLDAVDEAERAHLIVSTSDGREARFAFAHELIRQTLLTSVSLPRRQRLHLRVAEALENAHPGDVEGHASDIAHHLHQAGAAADAATTARYLAIAGAQALGAAAFEEALRLYESALSLHLADDGQVRAHLLYGRGRALRSLGRWDEALADWRKALAAFEQLGDPEAVGRSAAAVTELLKWDAQYPEALEISRRGVVALGERLSTDRASLLSNAGVIISLAGYYAVGENMINEALIQAEELGDLHLQGNILEGKALHHWAYMQFNQATEPGLRGAELLRSTGDLWQLASVLGFTQFTLGLNGRFDEAADISEEAQMLATRLGHQGARMMAGRARGPHQFMLSGDIGQWEAFAISDLELCRSAGLPWISQSNTFLGLARFWRGQWPEALQHFLEAVSLEPAGIWAGADRAFLFLCRAYAKDRDGALAILRDTNRMRSPLSEGVRLIRGLRALQPLRLLRAYGSLNAYLGNKESPFSILRHQRVGLPRPNQPNAIGSWTLLLAVIEGLSFLGERREAAKLYPLALEAIQTGTVIRPFCDGLLQTVAGMAAASGRQWDKAEQHFETALRQAHEIPVVVEQPEVRRWYAWMLLDRDGPGDREKARALLTEAIAMYRQIGMPKHVEIAEALLAGAGGGE